MTELLASAGHGAQRTAARGANTSGFSFRRTGLARREKEKMASVRTTAQAYELGVAKGSQAQAQLLPGSCGWYTLLDCDCDCAHLDYVHLQRRAIKARLETESSEKKHSGEKY